MTAAGRRVYGVTENSRSGFAAVGPSLPPSVLYTKIVTPVITVST